MSFGLFQPDCLDDLAYAIMYETTKLAYRVSEADVTRARNQVVTCVSTFLGVVFLPVPEIKTAIVKFYTSCNKLYYGCLCSMMKCIYKFYISRLKCFCSVMKCICKF